MPLGGTCCMPDSGDVKSHSMRVASRHMPAIARRPLGLAGWLFIVCLLVVGVYFLFSKPGTVRDFVLFFQNQPKASNAI